MSYTLVHKCGNSAYSICTVRDTHQVHFCTLTHTPLESETYWNYPGTHHRWSSHSSEWWHHSRTQGRNLYRDLPGVGTGSALSRRRDRVTRWSKNEYCSPFPILVIQRSCSKLCNSCSAHLQNYFICSVSLVSSVHFNKPIVFPIILQTLTDFFLASSFDLADCVFPLETLPRKQAYYSAKWAAQNWMESVLNFAGSKKANVLH